MAVGVRGGGVGAFDTQNLANGGEGVLGEHKERVGRSLVNGGWLVGQL